MIGRVLALGWVMALWAGQNPAHVQFKRHADRVGQPV
jgi:hypothetical protein